MKEGGRRRWEHGSAMTGATRLAELDISQQSRLGDVEHAQHTSA